MGDDSPAPLGYATAKQAHGTRITEHLVSLMRLLEDFTLHCFRRGTPYFVDSGTLLGCVRHRGIIPWDNDLDLAMLKEDFEPFLDTFASDTLILDRDGYGDPHGCVWMRDAASGAAGLDLSAYTRDGRALMAEAVQREWPIDAWGSQRSEGRGATTSAMTWTTPCGSPRSPDRSGPPEGGASASRGTTTRSTRIPR